jgi:hypothetical protein
VGRQCKNHAAASRCWPVAARLPQTPSSATRRERRFRRDNQQQHPMGGDYCQPMRPTMGPALTVYARLICYMNGHEFIAATSMKLDGPACLNCSSYPFVREKCAANLYLRQSTIRM